MELIERFHLPLHLVVGNHDDPAVGREVFSGTKFLGESDETRYVVDHESFAVVTLDSWSSDGPGGRLGEKQLRWLDQALTARRDVPVFVCLHHPPVGVGIPFLDGMRLADGAELGEVISRHRNIVRVLTGHVHRVITAPFAGTVVSVAPSTFRQTSLTLRADRQIGYLAEPTGLLLHVGTDNGVATHTVPVSDASALIGAF
ncbi:metallophosphoesterase [Nocardia salmonicida]|uniref:metallophosphoesterase n=1 Tax=Nocardia salmonicida TaxID=53431 RepID=UPI002E2D27A3|nr:metallophosphoesterase [Nocardia salmonicida]